MAYSNVSYTYTAAGYPTKDFTIPFGYIDVSHLTVYKNGVALTYDTDWALQNATTVRVSASLSENDVIKIARSTSPSARVVDWVDGAILSEDDLDKSDNQWFYLWQELADRVEVLETA